VLQKLYDLGARRVLVTGTGPLGCVPSELAQRGRNGQCAPDLQQAAALFNPQLEQMLQQLNRKLGRDVFIAANTGKAHNDFISNPRQFGKYIINHLNCFSNNAHNSRLSYQATTTILIIKAKCFFFCLK